jgi:hypothetical protein
MHRTMKALLLTALLAAGAPSVQAQDFTFGWNPRSGDVWMDTWLGDMNRYGSRYRDPFVDELVRYHGAPRDLVTDLLVNQRWAPGDVYMACNIAAIIGRTCRSVVEAYGRNHGQGWGNLAKQLGIKPGSPEFHRLKNGFVPVYDRWSRPIVLDAELQRVYPNHGKAKSPSKGNASHGNSGKSNSGKSNSGKSNSGKSNSGKSNSGKSNSGKPGGNGQGHGKGKG